MHRPRRCLAATRLADEAEGFASFDREADTVDGANNRGLAPQPPSANEVLDEGADFEQWHGAVTLQHRVGVLVSCPGRVPGRTSSTSPGGRVRRQTARAGRSHRGVESAAGNAARTRSPAEGCRVSEPHHRSPAEERPVSHRAGEAIRPCVYGCLGALKDRLDGTLLHDPARVHHHDAVRPFQR